MEQIRKNIITILIVVVSAAGLAFLFFLLNQSKTNWTPTFDEKGKEPYDLKLLHTFLGQLSPDKKVIDINEPLQTFLTEQKKAKNTNYIFTGNNMYLRKKDAIALIDYIKAGNTAFIASNEMPYELDRHIFQMLDEDTTPAQPESDNIVTDSTIVATEEPDTLYENSEYEDTSYLENTEEANTVIPDTTTEAFEDKGLTIFKAIDSSSITFTFTNNEIKQNSSYRFTYQQEHGKSPFPWGYFNDSTKLDEGIEANVLGYIERNKIAYIRFKIGDGYLYYHSLPLSFTNLYLKDKDGFTYLNKIFSYFDKGTVYWDSYHKEYQPENGHQPRQSPFKFLLENTALKWAWYLLLSMAIIYVLFYAKRRQRIIPLLSQNENTSIEYAEAVGRLYQVKESQKQIMELRMRNFNYFIKERYQILPSDDYEVFVKQLAAKSNVPEQRIRELISLYQNLTVKRLITNDNLFMFQKRLENFYKICK